MPLAGREKPGDSFPALNKALLIFDPCPSQASWPSSHPLSSLWDSPSTLPLSPHFPPCSCLDRQLPQLLAQSDLSMLSSSPASCTSPKPDTDNPDKKVHWASEKRRRASSTDSESKSHLDVSKLPRSRRPSRLTVKYDRGHLQRWLEMEQWVDAQLQELFQVGSLREAAGDCGPRPGPDTQRACLETPRGAGGTMCDVVTEHAPSSDGRKVLTMSLTPVCCGKGPLTLPELRF